MSSGNDDLFGSWDPPPATYTNPLLVWNHPGWAKIGEGKYISTREVREEIYECIGFWPLLDDTHGVPKLLDHRNFIKYCYYVQHRDELQQSEPPEDYIAMGFEHNEASREAWRDEQVGKRFRRQYWLNGVSDLPDFVLSEAERRAKRAKPNVNSTRNRDYIEAVKACQPNRIQALFDEGGISDLCPNCLEIDEGVPMNYRRGLVAYALDNLYGDVANTSESYCSNALECLRLVCSLQDVDVNADTWYTSTRVGTPLIQAVRNFDTEAAQILLDAGARTSFPDFVDIEGQWCNVIRPFEYSGCFKTALHTCVSAIAPVTQDEDVRDMLAVLLKAGGKVEVLVKTQVNPDYNDSMLTPSNALYVTEERFAKKFPLSMGVLQEAENLLSNTDELYKPNTSYLESENWANITDLGMEMQRSISRYMNICEWVQLKRSSKCLSSWPRPPTPQIDYHLIKFGMSNGRYEAYFGLAKTLDDALQAFKTENANLPDGNEMSCFAYQFIKIGIFDYQPAIPFVQFRQVDTMESTLQETSQIHQAGKQHFLITEAESIKVTPTKAEPWRRINFVNGDSSEAWVVEEEDSNFVYGGVSFDDDDLVGACNWLKEARPSVDINLRHLWHTQSQPGEFDGMEEIWLCEEHANPGSFRFGDNDTWAVCTDSTNLWSMST